MTTTSIIPLDAAQPIEHLPDRPAGACLAVVGYDGSASAQAALEAAVELIRGRDGHLEIVFVEHLPGSVTLSAPAILGVRDGFKEIEHELVDLVRSALDDREPRWHFQRREGSVADQLVAAASELRRQHGADANVTIVVGSSTQLLHHVIGSVSTTLTHAAAFPLLMVPPRRTAHPADVASHA